MSHWSQLKVSNFLGTFSYDQPSNIRCAPLAINSLKKMNNPSLVLERSDSGIIPIDQNSTANLFCKGEFSCVDFKKEITKKADILGIRVHFLFNQKVDYASPLKDFSFSGWHVPDEKNNFEHAAKKYPEPRFFTNTPLKRIIEDIVLLSFPNGFPLGDAMNWANKNTLMETTPRVTLPIADNFPKLGAQLGGRWVFVLETTGYENKGNVFLCGSYWAGIFARQCIVKASDVLNEQTWLAFKRKQDF